MWLINQSNWSNEDMKIRRRVYYCSVRILNFERIENGVNKDINLAVFIFISKKTAFFSDNNYS